MRTWIAGATLVFWVALFAAPAGASGTHRLGYVPKGPLVADLKFRPSPNGFRFANYGSPSRDLDAETMQLLFGRAVCRAGTGAKCILHPQAQAWLEEQNAGMTAGHCMGFSVASLLFFDGRNTTPSEFGARTTFGLKKTADVQRLIAYGFAFQTLDRVTSATLALTPAQALDRLIASLNARKKELYTIGIFKADGTGGHAITPFAVEKRPDGLFAILVYDNNWPNETRAMLVDRAANAWEYEAAINPNEQSDLYQGNAETKSLWLLPTFAGLGTNPCPFCGADAQSSLLFGAPAARGYDRITVTGDAFNHPHLLITDAKGRRLGYVDGKLVNQIPGAKVIRPVLGVPVWKGRKDPEYRVPTGQALKIVVDSTGLKKASTSSFSMITRGRDIVVNRIKLAPGQQARIFVRPDRSYAYTAPKKNLGPPVLRVGRQGLTVDNAFRITPKALKANATLGLDLDPQGELVIDSEDADEVVYDLEAERIDDEGSDTTEESGLEVTDEENDTVDYGDWDGGDDLTVENTDDPDAAEEADDAGPVDESNREALLVLSLFR